MKIYFAGSIRGGRNDADHYYTIINMLQQYGTVLTEHVGNNEMLKQEKSLTDIQIHNRDVAWIEDSDVMVAEVTQPSLGVGYELALAMHKKIKVLCLFRSNGNNKLSAMIAGQPYFKVVNYNLLNEVESILKHYFKDDNVVE